jgi:tetratricopeptide (TPR) repeat protein
MKVSFVLLLVHCLCTLVLWFCLLAWAIHRRWSLFFTLIFFISEPAVFLIWGPFRYYGLYVAAFATAALLAKSTDRFYIFLKTQEAAVRMLFWAAVVVFSAGMVIMTLSEINLRRDALSFWNYEVKLRPNAMTLKSLADAYYASKNMDKAGHYYEEAIQHDLKFIKAYEGLAKVAQAQKHWAQMTAAYQKIMALAPRLPEAYLGLAQAYRMSGQSAQAVETYSRLLTLFPENDKVYVKVIEAYGHAIADDPQNAVYKEKREEVLADFEQFSKRKNYRPEDYYNLAFLYEQVGGKEEAIRFYTKAVEMKPNYKQALYNLGNLYRDTGNYKIALAVYSRLIHFYPKYARAYLNMGLIFNALGDPQRAREFYLKVSNLEPENGDAYFNLGYLSESQGELSEAVNYYEKAVEVSPKNAEAYYNLGNAYANLGQSGEAIASYLKTVGINPKHQDAYVNLSILSFKSGDFQGAIHYLEDAQALGYNPPVKYLKTLEPYRKK